MTINLTVFGDPKAQKRPRVYRTHGFVRAIDPSATTKSDLMGQVYDKRPERPFEGPLCVDIVFYFCRPKSHYGTGKNSTVLKSTAPLCHASKPDRDNLDKLILDALTGIYWKDDAQVCAGHIDKFYSDVPRTEIRIRQLDPITGEPL